MPESVTVKINHPLDASIFDRYRKNYQDGFLKDARMPAIARKQVNLLKTTKTESIG